MTKRDELIDILARARYRELASAMNREYDDLGAINTHRLQIEAEQVLPVVVEFVAVWIRDQDIDPKRLPYDGDILSRIEDFWREDMGS